MLYKSVCLVILDLQLSIIMFNVTMKAIIIKVFPIFFQAKSSI